MNARKAVEHKRFEVFTQNDNGTLVYLVWDSLMDRYLVQTTDAQYAQTECNRMNAATR